MGLENMVDLVMGTERRLRMRTSPPSIALIMENSRILSSSLLSESLASPGFRRFAMIMLELFFLF
jgi:hypothetical protein